MLTPEKKNPSSKNSSPMTIPSFEPKSLVEYRKWLKKNHHQAKGVWLILAKKKSGLPTISVDEAIDESLCFGWVDSLPNKIDEKRFKLYISPRNPKSNWSRVNKEKIKRLEKEGRIQPSGQKMIDLAKETGTWDALNDVDNLIIPADFHKELQKQGSALKHFEAFPKSVRRGILEWILNAKKPETRLKRIQETALLAKDNKRANQYTKKE
jgi:uncharacterized protein YdeI (YjbR/CyaY-like superfamily)